MRLLQGHLGACGMNPSPVKGDPLLSLTESTPVAEAISHGPRALKPEKLLKSQTWPQKYIL